MVDKPAGCTSHDVVASCRRIFGQRRVGHAGTLDPDATGVLLVGLGAVTRLLRFVGQGPKSYTAEVVLGTATDTLDAGGKVTGTWDMAGVSLDDVRRAAAGFVGEITQLPPMVSAVKVGGRRLHELARQGREVERAPRPVTVWRLDVGPGPEPGVVAVEVTCSAGTYVRSLAADLGTALGGGAHLRRLRRTAVGAFGIDEAVPLEAVGPRAVRTPAEAVGHLPRVAVAGERARAVGHGAVLERGDLGVAELGAGEDGGPWAVVDDRGRLLAVYEPHRDGRVKPAVVVPGERGGPAPAPSA